MHAKTAIAFKLRLSLSLSLSLQLQGLQRFAYFQLLSFVSNFSENAGEHCSSLQLLFYYILFILAILFLFFLKISIIVLLYKFKNETIYVVYLYHIIFIASIHPLYYKFSPFMYFFRNLKYCAGLLDTSSVL